MEQVDRTESEFLLIGFGTQYDFHGYSGELYYKQESDGCYYRATMKAGLPTWIQQVEPRREPMSKNTLSEMWAGDFGTAYLDRHLQSNRESFDKRRVFMDRLFSKAADAIKAQQIEELEEVSDPNSILEVGCGDGQNLLALMDMSHPRLWAAKLYGADVNEEALSRLHPKIAQINAPAHDLPLPDNAFDIVFTCGLLIHIHPEDLPYVYAELWRVTRHVLFVAEYFSPIPLSIRYQDEMDILWKRDFGGELMEAVIEAGSGNDTNDSITVVDYGHEFKSMGGYDDLAWWMFKKEQP